MNNHVSMLSQWDGIDVTFTTISSAKINGRAINDPSWAKIYRELLAERFRVLAKVHGSKEKAIDELKKIDNGVKLGDWSEKRYNYVPAVGISVRYKDADKSWQKICELVREFSSDKSDLDFEAVVHWDNVPNSAFPGQTKKLVYKYASELM